MNKLTKTCQKRSKISSSAFKPRAFIRNVFLPFSLFPLTALRLSLMAKRVSHERIRQLFSLKKRRIKVHQRNKTKMF